MRELLAAAIFMVAIGGMFVLANYPIETCIAVGLTYFAWLCWMLAGRILRGE